LPPDLREDPTYTLNSYNWISFGTWEFDAHRRTGYLGDVEYFDHEIAAEEEENDQEDADEDEDEHVECADYDHDDGGPAWDPETQPPDINEEEAIVMALANSELDELSSLCGTGSQSSSTSPRSRREDRRLLRPCRRVPTTARQLLLRHGIRGYLHHSLLRRRRPCRSCRSLPYLLHRRRTSFHG
jgi:hypothetical protein